MKNLKRVLTALLALMLTMTGAMAAAVEVNPTNELFAEVPGVQTEDAVIEIVATAVLEELQQEYAIEKLLPTELGTDTLTAIREFVAPADVVPVEYYPEEVQQEIEQILNERADKEALIMTEFMSLLPAEWAEESKVDVDVLFDINYFPGQLVIVVIGIEQEITVEEEIDGEVVKTVTKVIDWTPLAAEVKEQGKIEFEIPAELQAQIENVETLFSVLTIRYGEGDGEGEEGQAGAPSASVTAGDLSQIEGVATEDGEELPEEFKIVIVDEMEQLYQDEIAAMRDHIVENPIITHFDQATQDQVKLLMSESVIVEDMLAYEIIAVKAENYEETYGDVQATFTFATPYADEVDENGEVINEMEAVVLLGLPIENPELLTADEETAKTLPAYIVEWHVLRADVLQDAVNVTFSAFVLPEMVEQSAMMVVLSEPLPQDIQPEATAEPAE